MLFKLLSGFNRDFAAAALILSFMNVFVLAILFYLLYRFIGGFLIPLFRTTSHVRQQFNNMNKQPGQEDHQSSTQNAQHSTQGAQRDGNHSGTTKVGEYIDFEEVK
jgi:Domain of unknown function (DUF4834)